MLADQMLAEALGSFVAVGKPEPHPVHYARKTTAPVAETLEWFVENEHDLAGCGVSKRLSA
jgi:hypothetical protein